MGEKLFSNVKEKELGGDSKPVKICFMVISQIKNVNNNSLICYRIPPYSAGFWWETHKKIFFSDMCIKKRTSLI